MALSTISGTTGITDATITSAKLADFSAAVDLNGVELLLDADADTSITADTDDRIDFKLGGVEHISLNNSSGDTVIKPMVDGKDIVFQQYDGNKILEINDGNYVAISGAAAGPGELRIYEDTDNGAHYTGFKSGNNTESISYILPLADAASSGYALTSNASGVLSWSAVSANTPSSADGQALGSASLEWSDLFLADSGTITFGNDQDTILTHTDGTGLTLNSTNKLCFNDASQFIQGASNAILDIAATDEIELTATLIDIVGNLTVSGTIVSTGTISGTIATATQNTITTMTGLVSTGALDSGSITSGFGAIDNGTSNIRSATITAETAFVPDASGGADLGTTSLEFNDAFFNDAAVINFGDDQDVTLTHVADTGILLNSTRKIQFGDSASFIHQSADSVLTIDGEATIDLNASTAVLVSNDLKLNSDAAVIGLGADNDVTLTHVADTGILLNSTMAIQFNDASQYINAPSNAILDINATDEIELNATLVDINANVEISGTATTTGVHTFTAVPVFPNNTVETADIQDNAVSLAKMAGLARGKIIVGDSSGDPAALAVGSANYVLTSDGTDTAWAAASSFDADAAQVFNESGADVDFRIESDDNANMLFVNGGDDRVQIGSATTDSGETLQVLRSGGAATLGIHTNRASANGSALVLSHNRNTSVGSFTVVNDNDKIGRITWLASDGGDIATEAAQIHAEIDGTPGANDMPTSLVFSTTADGASSRTERFIITPTGVFTRATGPGTATNTAFVTMYSDAIAAANGAMHLRNPHTDASGDILTIDTNVNNDSSLKMIACYGSSSGNAFDDLEFAVKGNGAVSADGSFSGSGADYGEYFESKTGNAVTKGTTLVLDGNKVRASIDSDATSTIIGVARPKKNSKNSAVIGNAADNFWTDKYVTNDYGEYEMVEYTSITWTEPQWFDSDGKKHKEKLHSYFKEEMTADGTLLWGYKDPPADGTKGKTETTTHPDGSKLTRRKLNSSFNEDNTYVSREDRDEWILVGLMGQVQITKGQKTGDRWIKMRDISDTVEEWYIK